MKKEKEKKEKKLSLEEEFSPYPLTPFFCLNEGRTAQQNGHKYSLV